MGLTAACHYPAPAGGARPMRDPITGRSVAVPRIAGTMIHRPEGRDNRGLETAHAAGRASRMSREGATLGFVIDRGEAIPLTPDMRKVLRGRV